jgi:hypothetical protein
MRYEGSIKEVKVYAWFMWGCGALVGFALGWFGCMITNGVPL